VTNIEREETRLINEEKTLDTWIGELIEAYKLKIGSDKYKNAYYVGYDLFDSLRDGQDLNLLGIHGPKETKFVIPDPNDIGLFNQTLNVHCYITSRCRRIR
jgi:hypothetical protein